MYGGRVERPGPAAAPSWWPDDDVAWARAAVRAGMRSADVEVEFDGLVVRAAPDGRVTAADVLDPAGEAPRPPIDLRTGLVIGAVAAALVAAEWLGYDGAAFLGVIVIACVLTVTFVRLRDERAVRPLSHADAPGAVDRQARLRRDEQVRGADLVAARRRLGEAHRVLWDLAGETTPERAAELRARHAALAGAPPTGAPPPTG